MSVPYYPGFIHTPNLGLSLTGMDEALAENFIILDSVTGGGGGTAVKVNGFTITNPNFNDTTPAAPLGFTNILWQKDGSGNVSAYVSSSGSSAWSALTGTLSNGQVIPYADAGISRLGAASLAIGNGTAGDFSGVLKLTTLTFADSTSQTTAGVTGSGTVNSIPLWTSVSVLGNSQIATEGLNSFLNQYSFKLSNTGALGVAHGIGFENHTQYTYGISLFSHGSTAGRAPLLEFFRSRPTEGTPTAVTSADALGYIAWNGYDGTSYSGPGPRGAYIQCTARENWTASAHGSDYTFFLCRPGTTLGIQSLRIGNDGYIRVLQQASVGHFDIWDGGIVSWSLNSTPDTGFSRLGSASLAVGNGTAGDTTGNLSLNRVNKAGADHAGQATITAGGTTKAVSFVANYTSTAQPVICLTPTSDPLALGVPVGYWVTYSGGAGAWTGFTVNIQTALAGDVTFNYIVVGPAA